MTKRYLKIGTIKERLLFRRRINETTNCWIWTGACASGGYGTIFINKKHERVHVVSYKEFIGEPKNLVLHKTNCTDKRCFNPEHLYDGTTEDNTNDMRTVGGYFKNNRGLGAKTRERKC